MKANLKKMRAKRCKRLANLKRKLKRAQEQQKRTRVIRRLTSKVAAVEATVEKARQRALAASKEAY